MEIKTKFNIGDKIFVMGSRYEVVPDTYYYLPEGPYIVGQISVKVTDSPGIPGKNLFDNYKLQKDYEESYMCVETGIGSGSIWHLDKVAATLEAINEKCYFANIKIQEQKQKEKQNA